MRFIDKKIILKSQGNGYLPKKETFKSTFRSMNDLAKARDFPNRLLCFSDVIFKCQGKLSEFMPPSKLASTFVLAFIEGVFMPLNRQKFSTPISRKFWRINAKRMKITGKYCFDRAEVWGK